MPTVQCFQQGKPEMVTIYKRRNEVGDILQQLKNEFHANSWLNMT